MDDNYISERIAQLRTKKGVSARDMSLSLGQSENYINMIENKKAFPSMTVFFYICEYLGIKAKDFFDDENDNPQLLDDIIQNLKKLDDKSLENVAGIVKGLADKK